MGGWLAFLKAYHYVIREEYGADAVLKLYDRVCRFDDRVKNFTKSILTVFNIKKNDAEAIANFLDIWYELSWWEIEWLERSKTVSRVKITKCPYKTEPKDISGWCSTFFNIAAKTINPKATVEQPIGMCAGDPYCEFVHKIED
jgi:hypothetical protein